MKTKKVVLVLVAICSMCCFAACDDIPFFGKDKGKETEKSEKKRKDTPTDVVKDFVSAALKGDITAMKECTTGDLREDFARVEEKMNKLPEEEQEMWREKYIEEVEDDLKDIEYVSEDIDGDKATVKIKSANGEMTFKLKKVDGKWKIAGIGL